MFEMIVWLILVIIFVVAEFATYQLVSIWLAIGSILALVVSIFHLPLWVQILTFLVSTTILLAATRPLVKKIQAKEKVATNVDMNIGKTAVVLQEINPNLRTGRATLQGVDWSAVSEDNSIIAKDTIVKILAIEGTKLIVCPANNNLKENLYV